MKENKKRKDYLQPDVSILSIDEESHLLAESPQVRPGGTTFIVPGVWLPEPPPPGRTCGLSANKWL